MQSRKISAIEAVLFSCGDAVSLSELSSAVGEPESNVLQMITELQALYDGQKRGMKIIRLEDCFQMCSREDYYDSIRSVTEPRKMQGLSNPALETLSIVAYHQPITKSRIDFIRGVDCSGSVARLCERGLIDEVGRMETPGRPILYGTTDEFLRCFGFSSLSEMPKPPEAPQQENFLEENGQ